MPVCWGGGGAGPQMGQANNNSVFNVVTRAQTVVHPIVSSRAGFLNLGVATPLGVA